MLSVCGSGDYAFAMLEKAKKIVIVDYREQQIELFNYRRRLIEEGRFHRFLNPKREPSDLQDLKNFELRSKYFSYARLDKIKNNLESATIETKVGNIFEIGLELPIKINETLTKKAQILQKKEDNNYMWSPLVLERR